MIQTTSPTFGSLSLYAHTPTATTTAEPNFGPYAFDQILFQSDWLCGPSGFIEIPGNQQAYQKAPRYIESIAGGWEETQRAREGRGAPETTESGTGWETRQDVPHWIEEI